MPPGDGNETTQWGAFYRVHRRALVAYAAALTSSMDDALDLIQEVLARLIADRADPVQPRAFVFRCLRNRAIDRARDRRRTRASEPSIGLAFLTAHEPTGPDPDDTARLHAALGEIADRQREVIVLRTFGELTLHEIAGVLQCPLGTVASHYARGIEALRSRLSEDETNANDRRNRATTRGAAGRAARSGA